MARSRSAVRSTVVTSLALASATAPFLAGLAPAQAADTPQSAPGNHQPHQAELKELALKTPYSQQELSVSINLPSTFATDWVLRSGNEGFGSYTSQQILLEMSGPVAYKTGTLSTGKPLSFARGSADNIEGLLELGTTGSPVMIAEGKVQIPLVLALGDLYKTFTITSTYQAEGTTTLDLPQELLDAASAEGLDLAGTSVTLSTKQTELPSDTQKLPAVCWTPTPQVAERIDLSDSRGIARVGNTFVIPAGLALPQGEDQDIKRIKLPADLSIKGQFFQGRVAGLELELKNEGYGAVTANLTGYLAHAQASGELTYDTFPTPLVSAVADSNGIWDFHSSPLEETALTGQVFNTPASPFAQAFADHELGLVDISCSQFPAQLQGSYNKLFDDAAPNRTWVSTVFSDVEPDTPFVQEIQWNAEHNILRGYEDGTFRPHENISRQAVAATLYRLAGSPSYRAPQVSPFTDVPTTHPFYTEIAWLYEQGISTGWEDGTFRPDESINRAALAAFFYRLAGRPEVQLPQQSPFQDLTADHPFYREITWLASTGVSRGWSDGTFRPADSVQRAPMAAFLYRFNHQVKPLI